MSHSNLLVALATLAFTFATGCRMDPGDPDYSSHVDLVDRDTDPNDDNLPGPNPYVPGEKRLMIGLFYEGGSSDQVLLNGQTTHYYIFVIQGSGQLTFTQESSDDRVEGRISDEVTLEGTPWWGGGIVWDQPADLSRWTRLYVSLKSSDPSFENMQLTMGSGTQVALSAKDYGFATDGEWHHLEIPLADFVAGGLDKSQVTEAFILGGDGGDRGAKLLVDALFFTQE
ncbi:hypothetical protein L6R52_12670 [Myxococcota bacterium]|nr:hypothetical protein [Myxococcota bacterium]